MARPVTAIAAMPPHRTRASEAASPMPVVRILMTQNDAVTTGTLLAAAAVRRAAPGSAAGRPIGAPPVRVGVGMYSVGCMPVRGPRLIVGGRLVRSPGRGPGAGLRG